MEDFSRTTDSVVSHAELGELLDSNRPLTVKFGADVTAPFLHLGHAVNLFMLRALQERGHKVVFLIGDFTTRVGDPSGMAASRTAPGEDVIEASARAFLDQVGRILITDDERVFSVRRNSEWWDKKNAAELLRIMSELTLARLSSRDMFRKRMEEGAQVRMNELVYPLLQGQDSVELASDLTIVGSDQLFNESMGRFLQERAGQKPQVIITTRISAGLDGERKQSKSLNNFVALSDSARAMFGKVMSLPDAQIVPWLEIYTLVPLSQVRDMEEAMKSGGLNPMEAKRRLAYSIVERMHGPAAAAGEERWFLDAFSGKSFPADAPRRAVGAGPHGVVDLLSAAAPERSRSELRRLLEAGAVELDGRRLSMEDASVRVEASSELRLRLGKRGFFRLFAASPSESTGPSGFGC